MAFPPFCNEFLREYEEYKRDAEAKIEHLTKNYSKEETIGYPKEDFTKMEGKNIEVRDFFINFY